MSKTWQGTAAPTTCAQRLSYIQTCIGALTSAPSDEPDAPVVLRTTAPPLAAYAGELSTQAVSTYAEQRACPVARRCLVCDRAATTFALINPFTVRSLGHLCENCAA